VGIRPQRHARRRERQRRPSSTLVGFGQNGDYVWDDRGKLDTEPFDTGTFRVDGDTVTFRSDERAHDCRPGDELVLEDVHLFIGVAFLRALGGRVARDDCGRVTGLVSLLIISL
jgi:hypothetical protein